MRVSEKVKCIDGRNKRLSISRQRGLLQLPRSSYFRPSLSLAKGPVNLDLINLIEEELLRYPFYGIYKIKNYRNRKGIAVKRKRIQSLMRLIDLD